MDGVPPPFIRALGDKMKSITRSKIRKLKGGWRIANDSDPAKYVHDVEVELCIQGNSKNGFHLIITPENFFTADWHHETLEDAIESAQESFDISSSDWS